MILHYLKYLKYAIESHHGRVNNQSCMLINGDAYKLLDTYMQLQTSLPSRLRTLNNDNAGQSINGGVK